MIPLKYKQVLHVKKKQANKQTKDPKKPLVELREKIVLIFTTLIKRKRGISNHTEQSSVPSSGGGQWRGGNGKCATRLMVLPAVVFSNVRTSVSSRTSPVATSFR